MSLGIRQLTGDGLKRILQATAGERIERPRGKGKSPERYARRSIPQKARTA